MRPSLQPPPGDVRLPSPAPGRAGRRSRLWIAGGLLTLAVAGAAWVYLQIREPEYAGRTVTDWAFGLNSADSIVRSNAAAALKAIGPPALPTLVRNLRTRDSLLKQPLVDLAPRLSLRVRRWFRDSVQPFRPEQNRLAAARALALFGTNAPVGPLIRALDDPEGQVAAEAANALSRAGRVAVPALAQASTDPRAAVRSMACYALAMMRPPPDEAIPALIDRLGDVHLPIRGQAASALLNYGRSAIGPLRETVRTPALNRDPQTSESLIRSNAAAVLRQIDPAALRPPSP